MFRVSRPVGLKIIALLVAAVVVISLPGGELWLEVLQDHGPGSDAADDHPTGPRHHGGW